METGPRANSTVGAPINHTRRRHKKSPRFNGAAGSLTDAPKPRFSQIVSLASEEPRDFALGIPPKAPASR
jgi:hypothetical protein